MKILIIGGTRNMGYLLAQRVLESGHSLTLLNRGITRDDLPESIPRLHCDRTDTQQLRRALARRNFDAVIDFVMFRGNEAEDIVDILADQVGHYIYISTGQVYLVRDGLKRPFKESDYTAPIMTPPEPNTYDYEEWLYGRDKSTAEDVFATAFAERNFNYTSLRLPMVNSERGGYDRLYGYYLRLKDKGPILVPDQPDYPLRHIYSHDVVSAILKILESGKGKGKAFNIAQDETVTLHEFLVQLGEIIGIDPQIHRISREKLNANGFLPNASPFSELWMSELDNSLSKSELGITYTPLKTYLENIITHWQSKPPQKPTSYARRKAEKQFVEQKKNL